MDGFDSPKQVHHILQRRKCRIMINYSSLTYKSFAYISLFSSCVIMKILCVELCKSLHLWLYFLCVRFSFGSLFLFIYLFCPTLNWFYDLLSLYCIIWLFSNERKQTRMWVWLKDVVGWIWVEYGKRNYNQNILYEKFSSFNI